MERLEGSDSSSIKAMLLEMGNSYDDQMAKEKAEYLAAVNKQVRHLVTLSGGIITYWQHWRA